MKINNKKGDAGIITAIIIGIIVIVVCLFLLMQIYVKDLENKKIQGCRNSIIAHKTILENTKAQVFTNIKCPTRFLKVDNSNLEKAKKFIAEDMHRCWHEWLRGDAKLFEGEGIFCHICSIYEFRQKSQKIDRFTHYLTTNYIDIRFIDDRSKTTYFEYFQGFQSARSGELLDSTTIGKLSQEYINTSNKYATVFVYASGKEWKQKALEGGTRATAGTVGLYGIIGGSTAVGVGIFVASNPIGWIVGGVLAIGAGGYLIYEAFNYEDPGWISFITIQPYNSEVIRNLQCTEAPVDQQSRTP